MIQSIIVYIIIAAAIGYVIFSLIRSLMKREKDNCSGCEGCELTNSTDSTKTVISLDNIKIKK